MATGAIDVIIDENSDTRDVVDDGKYYDNNHSK